MEAASDPALRHLLPALEHLREPWVSTFFNPTKEQHLSQLDHALQNQTITGTLRLAPTANTSIEDTVPDITFLFAPSFSTGTTTVGFDLAHRATPANPAVTCAQRSVSRAVRDDANGIFLSVSRLPTHTEIALSKLTPKGRTISLITLTTEAYDELLETGGKAPTMSMKRTLCSGVISTLHAKDHILRAPLAKLHVMDFAAEQRNIECFVGRFDSVAQVREYDRGRMVASQCCFARLGMGVTQEGPFVRGLQDWAISQAVMGCQIRIPGLCLPSAGMVEEDVQGMDVGNADFGTGRSGVFGADDLVKLLAGLDDANTLDNALVDGTTLGLGSGTDEQVVPLLKEGLQDFGVCEGGTLSKHSPVTSVITEAPPLHEVSNPPQERQSSPPKPGNIPAPEGGIPELAPQPPASSAHAVQRVLPRSVVPIAPAVVRVAERTVVTESLVKEQRRKARNRASALRSNEKKRLYLKKLKEDIADAEKREEVLRERELLLREENRELKFALQQ